MFRAPRKRPSAYAPARWRRQGRTSFRRSPAGASVSAPSSPSQTARLRPHQRSRVVLVFKGLCLFAFTLVPRINASTALTGWAVPAQVPEAVSLPAQSVFVGVWEPKVSQTLHRQSPPAPPHQTASGTNAPVAALLPRPWSFRDSKAGTRIRAGAYFNDITSATVQPLRL